MKREHNFVNHMEDDIVELIKAGRAIIETPSVGSDWFREKFMQQPVYVSMDFGSDEYETQYDPKAGTYKMIGPEGIEKRREWYRWRSRLDEKFVAENPSWDRKRRW